VPSDLNLLSPKKIIKKSKDCAWKQKRKKEETVVVFEAPTIPEKEVKPKVCKKFDKEVKPRKKAYDPR